MSLCKRDCSSCIMQMHCQGEHPFCNGDCQRCFSLCPSRPASFGYLKQLGGGKLELKQNDIAALPVFIPVLPDHMPERTLARKVIGVHGGKFLTSNGENVARVYRNKGLQEALNLGRTCNGSITVLC